MLHDCKAALCSGFVHLARAAKNTVTTSRMPLTLVEEIGGSNRSRERQMQLGVDVDQEVRTQRVASET